MTRRTFSRALVSRPPVEIKRNATYTSSDWIKTARDLVTDGEPWIAYTEPPLPTAGTAVTERVGSKISLKNWQLKFWMIVNSFVDNDTYGLGGLEKFFVCLCVLKKDKQYSIIGPPGVADFFSEYNENSAFPGYGGWGSNARRTPPDRSDYRVLWERWFPRDFPTVMSALKTRVWNSAGTMQTTQLHATVSLNFKLHNAIQSWDYTDVGAPDKDRIFLCFVGHKPQTASGTISFMYEDPTTDPVRDNYMYTTLYFRDA